MPKIKVGLLEQPGDVWLCEEIEIDEADFDPKRHLRAADYGGACDHRTPRAYCWDRVRARFEPMHHEHNQRVRDFMRLVELGARLAQAQLPNDNELGADAAEFIAIHRRQFPTGLHGLFSVEPKAGGLQ